METLPYTLGYLFFVAVIIVLICYLFKKSHPDGEFFYFDCPPPPGASESEAREFTRWQREKKINREFPRSEGYQPETNVTSPPPRGGSGVPDKL